MGQAVFYREEAPKGRAAPKIRSRRTIARLLLGSVQKSRGALGVCKPLSKNLAGLRDHDKGVRGCWSTIRSRLSKTSRTA